MGKAAKPTAETAATPAATPEEIPAADDGTVWLQGSTGQWHVEIGSETHQRLVREGAVEIPAPADA